MQFLDWAIVAVVVAALVPMVFLANRYTRSVADYLVSGRSAGRYLLCISRGMIWVGAVNIIMMFELYMKGGLNAMWWEALWALSGIYAAITGFGIYRFRQTRALTLAQFLEVRYGKAVRVISGILSWLTGMISFGFFPGVGARFFIYFCDLPQQFVMNGHTYGTFPVLMLILILISLFFVGFGGHIALLLTDFVQGVYTQIVCVVITLFLLIQFFDWGMIMEVLKMAPVDESLIDPARTGGINDFNIWFFLIGAFARWYNSMSYSAEQTYISSGKSAHETRMCTTYNYWRWFAMTVCLMIIVLVCKVHLQHPAYAEQGAAIRESIAEVEAIETAKYNAVAAKGVVSNQTVTLALREVLPTGFMGLFCAMMLACLISTYDTLMHTFGTVFVQDVIMPFRKTHFTPRAHMWMLRLAFVVVALCMLLLSYAITPSGSLLMFFALVNALWLGSSGAIILGGLYWKRGTNRAALTTLILGTVLSAFFITIQMMVSGGIWEAEWMTSKWANQQMLFFYTTMACTVCFIVVSLTERTEFNLDKMLHRGEYDIGDGHYNKGDKQSFLHRLYGITSEYSLFDRITAYLIVGWAQFWAVVVVAGSIYANVVGLSENFWDKYWLIFLGHGVVLMIIFSIWLVCGGCRDCVNMLRELKSMQRDDMDDGMV